MMACDASYTTSISVLVCEPSKVVYSERESAIVLLRLSEAVEKARSMKS